MTSKVRILCVDDEAAIRSLLKSQLEQEGYDVDLAEDGDVAIEKLGKTAFDVVLLDIRMPNVGGIDVLRHIRESGVKSRVIMLTAVDDLTIAMESVRLGAGDYLTKPFDTEDLFNAIRRVSAT
ncbi:MAG TPA: response regulator [Bacteroidota bacterium]|nr:response regulator [Bacteroidota bacterium]